MEQGSLGKSLPGSANQASLSFAENVILSSSSEQTTIHPIVKHNRNGHGEGGGEGKHKLGDNGPKQQPFMQ